MSISAKSVHFDEDSMWVELSAGRTLGVPLAWFPRLLNGSPAQRLAFEINRGGLHWAELDEDISIEGLLAGRGDQTRRRCGRGVTSLPKRPRYGDGLSSTSPTQSHDGVPPAANCSGNA
jgi:hypothetical protein